MSSSSGHNFNSTPTRDVKCHCNLSAQLHVTRNVRNYEKPYFNCAINKCKFFKWWRDVYPPVQASPILASSRASSTVGDIESMLLELKNQNACLLNKLEEIEKTRLDELKAKNDGYMKMLFGILIALFFILVTIM